MSGEDRNREAVPDNPLEVQIGEKKKRKISKIARVIKVIPNVKIITARKNTSEKQKDTTCAEKILGRVSPDPEGEALQCDYTFWTPKCMQPCRTRRCVLVWKCLGLFLQSQFVSAFVPSSLSTIERQFNLSSKTAGTIACLFDVGVIVVLLPISFWGNETRRLRLESCGYMVMMFGCFLFIMPQLLVGGSDDLDSLGNSFIHLCLNISDDHGIDCGTNVGRERYKYLFGFAYLLFGIGSAPILTTGTAYIDDNTKRNQGPVYLGVYMSCILVGAASGYVLNSYFLKIYVDGGNNPSGILVTDIDKWIGAWWIGPLLTIPLLIITAVALYGFPKRLPGGLEWAARMDESFCHTTTDCSNIKGHDLKALLKNMIVLLKNRPLIFIAVSAICELFFITGITTFGTKIIQNKFFLQADQATFYSGVTVVFIGATGFIIGGVIHGYGNLTITDSVRMIAIISLFNVPILTAVLIPCSRSQKVDLNTIYNFNCSLPCDCSTQPYSPGCGSDGLNYISPCHAGCTSFSNGSYDHCSCISSTSLTKDIPWTNGRCPFSCNNLPIYMILVSLETFLTFVMACPALNAAIRIVPTKQKSLALGFMSLLSRLLGSIPSPILVGMAFDAACLKSTGKACGNTAGTCTIHDQKKLAINLLAVFGTVKLVSTGALFMAYLTYKPPHKRWEAVMTDDDVVSLELDAYPGFSYDNPIERITSGITSDHTRHSYILFLERSSSFHSRFNDST